MRPAITILCFLLGSISSIAQHKQFPILGHANADLLATGWRMISYEMTLKNTLSVHYILPFEMKELAIKSIQGSFYKGTIGWNAGINQTGDEILQETAAYLGCGKKLTDAVYLKITGGYYSTEAINGLTGRTLYAELLCLYSPMPQLSIGSLLINPTASKIKSDAGVINLNQSYHVGLSYHPLQKINLLLEIGKTLGTDISGHIGLTYEMLHTLSIRLGLIGSPILPTWGIGGRTGPIDYAVGWSLHPTLGMTSGISLTYLFH